jgi:arsenite methyltransferase
MDANQLYYEVSKRYDSIANSVANRDQYASNVAKAFGHTDEQLAGIPDGANLGLSCGNPFAIAKLREVRAVASLFSHQCSVMTC